MVTVYNPARIINEIDTGKIRRARAWVGQMRGTATMFGYSEIQALLELAEALEEAGRAEEAIKARELAAPLIDYALKPVNQTVLDTQQSRDLPAQCFAFIALAHALTNAGRSPQADSAFKSADDLIGRISVIVQQEQHEPAELYSWTAGPYSFGVLLGALRSAGRGEAAERVEECSPGFSRNMAEAAIEIGIKDAARAQEDQDPHREGKAMSLLARALHEVGRDRESAFCAAEALRLGHGNYRTISGNQEYWEWSSTARPGSSDPAAYGYDDSPKYCMIPGSGSPETYIGDLIVGYLAIKTLGPFLQAFATKLGEQLGEATGRAISRIHLRRYPRTGNQRLEIKTEAKIETIVILPNPLTDEEREALIDIDLTVPGVQGMTLRWDENEGKFLPDVESTQARLGVITGGRWPLQRG